MSYDRDAAPAPVPGLRLLPWESEGGKPCFLSADGAGGVLSRLADEIEAEQLCDGADVLKGAVAVLDDGKAGEHALRLALRATTQAFGDVLRVADSRGARLPVAADGGQEADERELRAEPT
ncbi:hypothetical protein SLV14_003021 [Streptomyces sp. Je 1-4]|uniref:hypothetical protein n=1 Tax=Streptomyces TaxID=1883 RepID=UPI00140EA0FB|nr:MULTISPECIES: hypothetical protein [unclassified Streptomyces]QIK06991.1 hypothetical protein G7Z12_14010 [Streptomyces sp. ID38640]UYB40401.1 hypothetical protein SLV14_003021 [Streptomyces sp. Je 1-4]UZQ36516.1 hypothetical protein SLV14N_003021 [Streptomyces sp. Je 1-4] [Streptomyces sp. Je 1-4 4N24]UZQ43933.1 hypothetical protein SLV14NA_003021 [Streptomyces sp. Je 1-4] [Streptomyces sp. Je 1-4 4N24_ara]